MVLALLLLLQLPGCLPAPLDLRAARAACAGDALTRIYLDGLIAALDAYREGGSPESLRPVATAIAHLDTMSGNAPGAAQVASYVLRAAGAAAQSERDEMALMLDHARQLESVQLAAKQPAAPIVSAHEAAGDLWLQVHGYEQARDAYRRAAERVGLTPRVRLGLARAAARLKDAPAACAEYRAYADWWGRAHTAAPSNASATLGGAAPPAEVIEARTFLQQPQCVSTVTGRK